jgi:SAM-dependent methyltransferase
MSEGGSHLFDKDYFSSGAYAGVSFRRFSQYWWSNRFYAILVRRYRPVAGRVLEVGCGLGHLLGFLSEWYEVFGVDINAWALSEARRNVPGGHFAVLSAEQLRPFLDGSFHVVIAKHVVEHLSDPDRAIAEMARVLVPGGMLLLATPNTASLARSIKKEKWVGYKDHTHINLRPPEAWLESLSQNGFLPKRVFSDGFWDAPYLRYLPVSIQKVLFGFPGGLQAIFGWSIIPLRMGESLIVIAEKR